MSHRNRECNSCSSPPSALRRMFSGKRPSSTSGLTRYVPQNLDHSQCTCAHAWNVWTKQYSRFSINKNRITDRTKAGRSLRCDQARRVITALKYRYNRPNLLGFLSECEKRCQDYWRKLRNTFFLTNAAPENYFVQTVCLLVQNDFKINQCVFLCTLLLI